MKTAHLSRGALGTSAPTTSLLLGALVVSIASCSVEVLPEKPVVTNSCKSNSDCGASGICTDGACYSRNGVIDQVLLEIIPEASSPLAGAPLLSMQEGLRRGDRSRAITLTGPLTFPVQVWVNGEDLPDNCPYPKVGRQSIAARVQLTRVGAVAGVPVASLSNATSLTITTEPNSSGGYSKDVSLVPGSYDVYAQPVTSGNCQIPSKMWRGVDFARDGQVLLWAPPATLDLPKPLKLNGRVTRVGGTLADWQVDLVDPQDSRVISTAARLGATTDASPYTNFEVWYQPLEYVRSSTSASQTLHRLSTEPLIRLKPPKDAEGSAPIVYFDLAATDLTNSGQVGIVVSDLPTPAQLVTVSGQVRSKSNEGVKATVKFLNFRVKALNTSFGPAVTTDAAGRYTTKLFPGSYRVVIVPEGATDDGTDLPGANPARLWALTELQQQNIGTEPMQTLDLGVEPIRVIEGMATAGTGKVPAQGATLEAVPLIPGSADVLRTVINPPISPARASVPVDDTDGRFTLLLDPGYYDFALKPAAASNFAWWIWPSVHVLLDSEVVEQRMLNPQLFYPVPLAGTISVTMQDKPPQPLRNATVRAYAQIPTGDGVTQVGTARTDDMGRYQLALPPAWGSVP